MSAVEFLIRVRPDDSGAFEASIRQYMVTSHPEVRAVIGPVTYGEGANVEAAMIHAIARAHIGTVVIPKGTRYV